MTGNLDMPLTYSIEHRGITEDQHDVLLFEVSLGKYVIFKTTLWGYPGEDHGDLLEEGKKKFASHVNVALNNYVGA